MSGLRMLSWASVGHCVRLRVGKVFWVGGYANKCEEKRKD